MLSADGLPRRESSGMFQACIATSGTLGWGGGSGCVCACVLRGRLERLLPANTRPAWKGVSKLGHAISGPLQTKKVWDLGEFRRHIG